MLAPTLPKPQPPTFPSSHQLQTQRSRSTQSHATALSAWKALPLCSPDPDPPFKFQQRCQLPQGSRSQSPGQACALGGWQNPNPLSGTHLCSNETTSRVIMTSASLTRPKALLRWGEPPSRSGQVLGTDTWSSSRVWLSTGLPTNRMNEGGIRPSLSPRFSMAAPWVQLTMLIGPQVFSGVWPLGPGAGWSLNPSSAASELCVMLRHLSLNFQA